MFCPGQNASHWTRQTLNVLSTGYFVQFFPSDKLSADGQRQIDKVCIFVVFAAKNKQFFRKKKQNEFLQKVCFHRKKQTVLSISEDKLQQRNFFGVWTKRGGRGGGIKISEWDFVHAGQKLL